MSEIEQRFFKLKNMETREDADGKRVLAGYFSVFDEPYQVCDGWIETIARGAFARYLAEGGDVKILWNHDSNIVLGSTSSRTAALREDEKGLYGEVSINDKDQDALNAYARVMRGDVTGCSFGFEIGRQEEWWDDEGVYHTKVLEVYPLYEVSPCTFPAYRGTSIEAREQFERAKQNKSKAQEERLSRWRQEALKRLKGE